MNVIPLKLLFIEFLIRKFKMIVFKAFDELNRHFWICSIELSHYRLQMAKCQSVLAFAYYFAVDDTSLVKNISNELRETLKRRILH